MKSVLPALSLVLLFASCTTAYKTGQTPDDVYFSPQRPQDEYVRMDNKRDKYRYDEQSEDDRYLRMKVRNRRLWSDLDYYYNDPYAYRYNSGYIPYAYNPYYYSSPWSAYSYWNYTYNPYNTYYNPYNSYYSPYGHSNFYGSGVIVANPNSPVYNRPRTTNLRVFDNTQNSYNDISRPSSNSRTRVFGNSGNNNSYQTPRSSNTGSDLRNIFGNSNSSGSSSSQSNAPVRSQSTTSSSSSSSSGSSSGSNAPVRKF